MAGQLSYSCGLHSTRASADNNDFLRVLCFGDLIFKLVISLSIYGT